jgi:hypothetical protein
MNSLKPCPFCGGAAELCYGPGLGTDSCRGYTLYASCNECGAKSPGLWQEKKPEPSDPIWDDVAAEWNCRPGEEALKQLWSSNLDIINRELNKQYIEARAEAERLRMALEALYSWVKAEADHFGANAPDDDMIVMVSSAIKAAKGEI